MTPILQILFSPWLTKILMFGLVCTSVFLLVYYLFPDEEQLAAQKRLGVEEERIRPTKTSLLRRLYPVYSIINTLIFRHYLPKKGHAWIEQKRPYYHQRLIVANLRDEITPDEFVAFKACMMLVLTLLFYYFAGALGYSVPAVMLPVVLIFGFVAPDLWLKEMINKRRKSILKSLPYTLDLLTLSVEAGMDFIAAIQRLTQRTQNNPMVQEFSQMLKEIRLGTVRSDALRNLSNRLEIEEVSSFTTLLIQADQLGASIGDVLRAQSDQMRTKRFQNAETAGAKASQFILIPLVVCIFPAVFIVILGPTILNMLSRGIFH